MRSLTYNCQRKPPFPDQLIAGSSNGRTQAFEAWYDGSSPSPAAKFQKKKYVILRKSMKKIVLTSIIFLITASLATAIIFIINNYQPCGYSLDEYSEPEVKCSCIGIKQSRQDLPTINAQDMVIDYCYGYALTTVCFDSDRRGQIIPIECPRR